MSAASRVIAVASWLVPAAARGDFRREWEAEIAWWSRQTACGAGPRRKAIARHTLGAFAHALWLRKEQWSLDMLWQDLRYAWRLLAAQSSFTVIAALTLALGIGANGAIFSVVYGVLLKPLPFREPDRLVQIFETNPLRNWTHATASPANLFDWMRRNKSFEDIAFYPGKEDRTPMFSDGTLTGTGDQAERLRGVRLSANMLRVLGVQPMLGRDFRDDEQVQGKHRVVLLSNDFWKSHFGGDPSIVGREITLNALAYSVIGVMPKTFRFPDPKAQLWMPLVVTEAVAAQRRPHYMRPVARLKPGVTIEQARQDLAAISAQLEREFPDTNTQMGTGMVPLHEWIVGDVRTTLVMFLAAVGLVLLVACANLANLLLARATGRRRELAVRFALGATGWRLARQMLTENLLLAAMGGGLGIAIARWTLSAVMRASPEGLPRLEDVALDWQTCSFVALVTAVTALLTGMVPAWTGSRTDAASLRDGSRTTGPGGRMRRVLVIAQVAASVALVVCAGLLLRSFERLQTVSPGFNPEGVVTFRVSLSGPKYSEDRQAVQFWETLLTRVRAMPGVRSAGGSTVIGLDGSGWTGDLFVDGRQDFHARQLRHKDVTPGYFEAMGLTVLKGRDLADSDVPGTPPVAVVNDALVRAYFKDEDPIGKRISYSYNPQQRNWRTIVGIVTDEKQDSLAAAVVPEVYETHRQNATSGLTIAVRGAARPASLVPGLRQVVRSLDSEIAMHSVRTLGDVVTASVARERFATGLVALFAALALMIAAVGVYGVVSYSVSRRTREIGLRMALGADRAKVIWLVFREAVLLVGTGLVLGLMGAAAAAQGIRALLFQTSAADGLTYVSVVVVIGGVAALASYLPARRALSVDPMTALRSD